MPCEKRSVTVAKSRRLIRTIARKGFRFVGEVREERASGDGAPSTRTVEDSGEQKIKNIGAAKPPPALALALPDKPSIAVLPFQNLSGDPEQEYFADGIVEDIITALSRMRWLFVIARNSSFTYKGRAVDVKQVGRELGRALRARRQRAQGREPGAHQRDSSSMPRPERISGQTASTARSRTSLTCRIR